MAQYKVLQDVEAEDKFVGPLTLKQFIMAGVTFVAGYLSFLFLTKHLWFLTIPLIPIMLLSGFLAWPWMRDQPTEVWLLAKIRFMLKPRRRIWDQTGMQELVTITAPKHRESYVASDLSPTEVKSRLKALAETIDSRGWATKNASVNLYNQPAYGALGGQQSSDRLLDLADFAREVPNVDVQAADDILDERNNPTAQHLDQMIAESSAVHRKQTLKNLDQIRAKSSKGEDSSEQQMPNLWFAQPTTPGGGYTTFDDKTVVPGSDDDSSTQPLTADEQKLLGKLHSQPNSRLSAYGHTKVLPRSPSKTKSVGKRTKRRVNRDISTSRIPSDPAILELAGNDDLTVATLARQANKKLPPSDGEVVIKLH